MKTVLVLGVVITGACYGGAVGYISPVSVVADGEGQTLYVAEHTRGMVGMIDLASGQVRGNIAVGPSPVGVGISSDNRTLYVTSAVAEGKVQIVDIDSGYVRATIDAGHTPVAVVVSSDGKRLYVCCRYDNSIAVIDVEAGKRTGVIGVSREPVAALLSRDDKTL